MPAHAEVWEEEWVEVPNLQEDGPPEYPRDPRGTALDDDDGDERE